MATIEAGLRRLVVDAGVVSGRVFRVDSVPDRPTWPYVTFVPLLSDVPSLRGAQRDLARRRETSFDLWQHRVDVDDALVDRLVAAFDGARPVAEGRAVWTTRVTSLVEVPDPAILTVHHALTVSLHHS